MYKKYKDVFRAIVNIPLFNRDTLGRDIEELLARKETFSAAIQGSHPIMVRQRLTMFWRAMCEELDKAQLV